MGVRRERGEWKGNGRGGRGRTTLHTPCRKFLATPLFMTSAGRYCDYACLVVGLFAVHAFRDFSQTTSPTLVKFDTKIQQNSTVKFWEVKVKVQGHNLRAENLCIVIDRPWFQISSTNLAIQQIVGYRKYFGHEILWFSTEFKTESWRRLALSECFLVWFIFITEMR